MSNNRTKRRCLIAIAAVAAAIVTALLPGSVITPAPSSAATVWLCKPGMKSNPCAVSMASTALYPDGTTRAERPRRPKAPPVDCFYVYPTVSTQPTGNSNLTIEPEEVAVAQDQASRFSAKCQVYAPMYRQLTKAGSMLGTSPPTTTPDPELAYRDVRAAWREYLRKFNRGRGVILLGHSQGAKNLTRLVQEEIDGNAKVRKKLVSAMIIGAAVLVPDASDVGGSFQRVPACRQARQTGCVIAYNTYPSTPPLNAFFGITLVPGMRVLCVNPNGLAPGVSGPALPYVPTARVASALSSAGFPVPGTWWVSLPDMYSTQCLSNATHTWLQANDVSPAGDRRPRFGQALGPRYGFHQVDITLNLGSLVRLAGSQAAAWKKKAKASQ